jgi:hypothetical protein
MRKWVWLIGLVLGGGLLYGWFSAQDSLIAHAIASQGTSQQAEPVKWTGLVNCAVRQNTLQKIRGRDDSPDAGACSTQRINEGAYLEFAATETGKERYVGLSAECAGTSDKAIDFALHLTTIIYRGAPVVEVRERGVYKAETSYSAQTAFRIAVEGAAVKYYKDDECFYVSKTKPPHSLAATVSLFNIGAAVRNAIVVKGKVETAKTLSAKSPNQANNSSSVGDPSLALKATANSPWAGIPDDNKIYLPPDYATFTPPNVGSKYFDTVFGTTLVRLSNGQAQLNDAIHHEYATMSPFNKDGSLILLQSDQNGFFIVDRNGRQIVPPAALQLAGLSEPRWSGKDAQVFYYHDGNQLKKFDVLTRQKSNVHTFPQYQKITFGGGEGDISEDGDHLLIMGDDRQVGMYTLSSDTLGRVIDLKAIGDWHEIYVTANNNMLVRWSAEGTGKNKGMGLFDKEMNFIRQVVPFVGHNDQGRDSNGDEVLLIAGYRDTAPAPGCENNGVEKVRLSDSKKTCLVPLNWDTEIHVSSNSDRRNPWVLVSVTDTGKGTAEANNNLPPDWRSRWGVRFNELILAKIDGSERRRIAHHRSRTLSDYWFQPRAAISRDGSYAIFDSNFGINPLKDYTDVFLAYLAKTGGN